MNGSEITRYTTLIRDRLKAIEGENLLGLDGQSVVELDQQSVGRLSRMDALQNQAMQQETERRREVEIKRIDAALHRLGEDEFGT